MVSWKVVKEGDIGVANARRRGEYWVSIGPEGIMWLGSQPIKACLFDIKYTPTQSSEAFVSLHVSSLHGAQARGNQSKYFMTISGKRVGKHHEMKWNCKQ